MTFVNAANVTIYTNVTTNPSVATTLPQASLQQKSLQQPINETSHQPQTSQQLFPQARLYATSQTIPIKAKNLKPEKITKVFPQISKPPQLR